MHDAPRLDLKARPKTAHAESTHPGPPGPLEKRFDCFLIDTGWNEPVSRAVRTHLPTYFGPNSHDPLYILSREQSACILRLAPELIGHDPTVVVYDLYQPPAGKGKRSNYKGFRLNLGLMKNPQQALARLQEFVRFVMMNRTSHCLECEVKRQLHQEGLEGMVKIMRDVSEATVELI